MQLTESYIKQIMLRYLKTHYKYRIGGDGKAQFKLDQYGKGGIIADGYITFQLDDETPFLATFEATSADSHLEVQYILRARILLLDSFSFALTIITIAYLVLYFFTQLSVKTHGFLLNIGLVCLGIFILGLLYYFLFRYHRHYRYIYAIEQFKQYYADDQWIAIGSDVFEKIKGKAIRELKRQCTSHGIGLVVIDEDSPQLIIAPSRQDEFRNRRRSLLFVNRKDSIGSRTFRAVKTRWDRLWVMFTRRSRIWNIQRFQRIPFIRIAFIFFSFSIIALIFWQQLSDQAVSYMSAAQRQQTINAVTGEEEARYYTVGKENLSPFDGTAASYLEMLPEDERTEDPELRNIEIFMASDSRLFTYYDCTRLQHFDENKYMIKWRSFAEFEQAKQHVVRLMQHGIRCNVIWHGCFTGKQKGYIVFLDIVYHSLENANRKGDFLKAWLHQEGEPTDEMAVLVIRR